MSIGDPHAFHFTPEGLPNTADLDKATALRLKEWRIVRGVTIAYCAGYDEKERIIYVDEKVPETFTAKNGITIKVIEGSLFWHESIEADLLWEYPAEHYQGAHTIATYMENAYVKAHGVDPAEYEAWWAPIIKEAGSRKVYERVPTTLDLRPYEQSDDQQLIEKMRFVKVTA